MTTEDHALDDKHPYFYTEYEETLFRDRYQDPGRRESERTWEDVFTRVSTAVALESPIGVPEHARPEMRERFNWMMADAVALPSSPQLWNFGSTRHSNRNGSSCFTGAIGDNLESFNKAVQNAERVYVYSGGFGVLLNSGRPQGCKISYAKSAAVGVLGEGGPLSMLESKTGYITNGGRERGALMAQLSAWHPDAVRFILAKKPTSRGFLDDWPVHARAMGAPGMVGNLLIERYASYWSHSAACQQRDWPTREQVDADLTSLVGMIPVLVSDTIDGMLSRNLLAIDEMGRMVPQVFDPTLGDEGSWRKANRDWDIPLQNCNMSIRVPDALILAAERDDNWCFAWDSVNTKDRFSGEPEYAKPGEQPWVKTDIGGDLVEWNDGRIVNVHYGRDNIMVSTEFAEDPSKAPRYTVALTTWAGLIENLKPNPNNFKETAYARWYRDVLLPEVERYGKGVIKARQVLDLIFRSAHGWADPGVVFEDTYETFNPIDSAVYGVRFSNPCSEFVEAANGSCNLISENLRRCLEIVGVGIISEECQQTFDGWDSTGLTSDDDWLKIREMPSFKQLLTEVEKGAKLAYQYIQFAHEYNIAPVPEIDEYSRHHYRTVGVGIMGLAEVLMAYHVTYGSDCAAHMTAAIMATVYAAAWEESFRFVEDYGQPKPLAWSQERMAFIFSHRVKKAREHKLPLWLVHRLQGLLGRVRLGEYATNTCVTSVAPTGSISQIASMLMTRRQSNGVMRYCHVNSSGEPVFSPVMGVQNNAGRTQIVHDMWDFTEKKDWHRDANEVSAHGHSLVHAAICDFCCMSASKTINVPEVATVDDVAEGYLTAWRKGIPGTSLYRDNSKPMQVLTRLDCPSGDCKLDFGEAGENEGVTTHFDAVAAAAALAK